MSKRRLRAGYVRQQETARRLKIARAARAEAAKRADGPEDVETLADMIRRSMGGE